MAGQPVYLNIRFNREGDAGHTYCDSQGRKADEFHVELTGGGKYTIVDFLVRAISRYDSLELARVKAFNVDLAVHIVRRRLQHWTREGWSVLAVPGEEELFGRFVTLELARENY